jgi:predicted nicotinamide N-methyase
MNPGDARGRLSVLPTDFLSLSMPAEEDLYRVITSRYEVKTSRVEIRGEPFEMLLVRDSNALLENVSADLFSEDERLPYWADLWTSSIDLAGWVLEGRNVAGKNILELGSGLGLAGLAAVRAGARVTLTDYETDALLFARYNSLRNLPRETAQHRVRCVPLDWRAPDIRQTFDVIMGADIVYERKNFGPILAFLKSHLAPGGCALLTEPDRTIGQAFLAEARESRLSLDHRYSSVVRDGRTHRISRMIIRHGKSETA